MNDSFWIPMYQYFIIVTRYLVDTLWFSHGGLDGQGFDILPVLLEERNQEVDGQVQVLDKLIFRHINITNSNIEAKDLLHLELDGSLDIIDFTKHIILMGQHGWEFTGLVQTWTQKTWDLFDQGFRSKESIVLLGKLLDQFLENNWLDLGSSFPNMSKEVWLRTLSLLSFLRSSADMCGTPFDSASSLWAASPITQICCFGLGMFGNLNETNVILRLVVKKSGNLRFSLPDCPVIITMTHLTVPEKRLSFCGS